MKTCLRLSFRALRPALAPLACLILNAADHRAPDPGLQPAPRVGVQDLIRQHPEAPLRYLWDRSAADFRTMPAPKPRQFQAVRFGFTVQPDGTRMYLLGGSFRPEGDTPWIPFVTLKTEGYEQWIGGMAKTFGTEHAIQWLHPGDLSSELLEHVQRPVPSQGPGPETSGLGTLTWLQGRWLATKGGQTVEEQWSLQGRSLLGVSRTLAGGQSRSVELLMLEPQGADVVLRLRMFGPALDKAGRGKDEPLRLKLVEADATHFRCEGIGPEEGTVLVYTRKGADGMEAHISKTREGKVVWEDRFSFQRVR